MGLDWRLFTLINGLAGRYPLLDAIARLFVNDYAVPTALSAIVLALWFVGRSPQERGRNQRALFYALFALVLANVVVKACNLVFFRPRPFSFHEVNLLFYHPSDSSMPSNPAATGFALAGGVWLRNRRAAALMFILATMWAIARVYCGVHYPSDVVVGALVGLAAAQLIGRVSHQIEPVLTHLIDFGQRLYLA
ncbi:MAG: phosphatase PAP2 family protein [Chloroflexi bacterium]|nr:phosphatase PAP2 family protein [Chloroflexota bacterium]